MNRVEADLLYTLTAIEKQQGILFGLVLETLRKVGTGT